MTTARKSTTRRATTGIQSRRGEKLTDEELNEYIVAYTERDETLAEIGARFRRSVEYVRRVLIANNVEMRVARHKSPSDEDLLNMAEDYDKGMSISAVARAHYASPATVKKALEQFAVSIRGNHFVSQEEDAEFKRLYEAGKTLAEISEITGRGASTVRMRLVKLGVPMRPHGGSNARTKKLDTTDT